jgi:hypothetical protein
VKIQNLTGGLVAALVLASPIVGAEDYPAANFEPTVIYSDIDKTNTTSSSKTKVEKSQPDSQYPAANFKPTVVYHDSEYKHTTPDSSSAVTGTSTSSTRESVTKNSDEISVTIKEITDSSAESEAGDESIITLLGLLALGLAGFFLLKDKASAVVTPKKIAQKIKATKKIVNLNTGVGRYLNKNMPELSSVAKYLKTKEKIPASGVSKYVAKRIVAAKAAAASKRTGVEKYLRDRG